MSVETELLVSDLMCRVCLNVEELMVNIYEEVEDLNSDLRTLLAQCGDLKVDRADAYPKYLCKECTSELLIAAKFREKCSKSKEILQQYETKLCELDRREGSLEENECSDRLNESCDIEDNSTQSANANEFCPVASGELPKETECVMFESDKQDRNSEILMSNDPDCIDTNALYSIVSAEKNEQNLIQSAEELIVFDGTQLHDDVTDVVEEAIETNDALLGAEQQTGQSRVTVLASPGEINLTTSHLKFACDICGAAFACAENLRRHLNFTHATAQLHTCEKCKHSFSAEDSYHKHLAACTVKEVCVKNPGVSKVNKVDTSSKIKRRQILKLPQEPQSKICTFCGKECQTQFALTMHLRTHTGERPFTCDICPKSFSAQSTLKAHMKRHTGIPDYICPYCTKSFFESTNLRAHIRTHTGEKPHGCTVCGKRFSRVFLLQLHMRTHTGEKPYSCSYCQRSFSQLCDMRNHERTHTGEKQFHCPICSKGFVKRRLLRAHMKQHGVRSVDLEGTSWTQYSNPTEHAAEDETEKELSDEMLNEYGIPLEYNLDDLIAETDL